MVRVDGWRLDGGRRAGAAADPAAVIDTYGDIAHAMYEDALTTAKALQAAVDAFLAEPTEDNLKAARDAWKAARVPYQQTEGYRFGNAIVDDWEGKVNAWPLDEGLIDYVDTSLRQESRREPALHRQRHRQHRDPHRRRDGRRHEDHAGAAGGHAAGGGGVEANVATGYHAIEFLLWGQDLNGTGPGAGERPATDYDTANCTNGNCDRRAAYLKAATDLLVADLEEMVGELEGGRRGAQGA